MLDKLPLPCDSRGENLSNARGKIYGKIDNKFKYTFNLRNLGANYTKACHDYNIHLKFKFSQRQKYFFLNPNIGFLGRSLQVVFKNLSRLSKGRVEICQ